MLCLINHVLVTLLAVRLAGHLRLIIALVIGSSSALLARIALRFIRVVPIAHIVVLGHNSRLLLRLDLDLLLAEKLLELGQLLAL